MNQMYCQNETCLCHFLCPTGHYIGGPAAESLGCTYYPNLERHHRPCAGAELSLCLCSGICSGCSSAGEVVLIAKGDRWLIKSQV
jgi:hypothetical protein